MSKTMNDYVSSDDFIQASRVLKVVSPLGEDVLLPERVTITEGVSELFTIEIAARAKREDVKPAELIGRLVDVSVEVRQGADDEGGGDSAVRRPFNGLVTNLHEGPPVTRGLRSYTLTLRPQMWLLSRRSDCRIFLDKTTVEICETLFAEHGLPAPDCSGVILSPPAQHYSVQYNETDLDYLTRRFQEDGLFFWFEHETGRHKLMVADHQSGWSKPSSSAEGEDRVRLAQGSSDRNHIDDWGRHYAYVPGQRAGADWNFETPGMVPGAMTPSMVELPDSSKRELYEYPARAMDPDAVERMQRLRMQAVEADHDRVFGASNVRVLEPGRRFTPYEEAHPDRAYEEHVILRTTHRVVDRSYETASDEPEYRNAFETMPSRIPATPHRGTRRPRIEGAQVAIVAGPAGEEIHPDQYGRIKVWFPWDRRAKKDGSDTCWVRVSQNWAGGGWGGQIIPRIGMEVMVAYIDGDPDRPLVTGVVPNARQTVAYDLPANKTKSVFRTNTHKSNDWQQSNELAFEDETGREEVFIHAQRDATTKVRNHASERVDRNKVVSVGGVALTEVGQNRVDNVGHNMTINVGGGAAGAIVRYALSGNRYGVKQAAYFLGDMEQLATDGGNFGLNAAGSIAQSADQSILLMASEDFHLSVGATATLIVGENLSTAVTKESTEIVGTVKTIEAHETLRLRCGEAELVMHANGDVTLNGKSLASEFGDNIKMKSNRIDLN